MKYIFLFNQTLYKDIEKVNTLRSTHPRMVHTKLCKVKTIMACDEQINLNKTQSFSIINTNVTQIFYEKYI